MTDHERYISPLSTRYASTAMQRLWGATRRARLWRELWLALAEEQKRLGIDIPDSAIEELRTHLDDVDLEQVRLYEERFRHDVMAHIHALGDLAPSARPFLHLGATSAFVTDNAEAIVIREALRVVLGRLIALMKALDGFATRFAATPTVAYTHFQPAQLTTVGKRATLWLHDFFLDGIGIRDSVESMVCRGCKGTTGTQASYLDLFHGDHGKVRSLDQAIAARFGFREPVAVSGQTYTRKLDSRVLALLSGVAQSASKFATDLRLLQHEGEVLEPNEREQIGSSAMAYKRNPMRAERVCALARYVMSLESNAVNTAATQWLERTLDDSANRRISLPEAFLATDAVLILCANIAAGLQVNEAVVARNVDRVIPFMATERWLLLGVEAGGDRQTLHEVIRRHSRAVSEAMARGAENDLLERLSRDEAFARVDTDALLAQIDAARYIGRAPEQVREFSDGPLKELLESLNQYTAPDEAKVTI